MHISDRAWGDVYTYVCVKKITNKQTNKTIRHIKKGGGKETSKEKEMQKENTEAKNGH